MKVQLKWVACLSLVLACVAIPYSAFAADSNAYLYIAHAAIGRNISSTTNPAYPVDISIGGHCIVQGLSLGEIRGPFTEPAASYAIKVSIADSLNPCGNPALFSPEITLAAGTTSMGIVTLNNTDSVSGKIFTVDLAPVAVRQARVILANTTSDNLAVHFVDTDKVSLAAEMSQNIAAGAVVTLALGADEYRATITAEGSTMVETGPMEFQVGSRNVYVIVLAGSIANQSIQFIGPQVIRDSF